MEEKGRKRKELEGLRTHYGSAAICIAVGLLLLVFSAFASVISGVTDIGWKTVWAAVTDFDPTLTSHQVIRELRLPRTTAAALVGAFLAVSGAVMQGLTRNPLASPSIMGVSHGAAFALILALVFFPGITNLGLTAASFIGAGLGVVLVFLVGSLSKGGLTPVKLALAGVAVGGMLSSLSSALSLHFQVAKHMSFWYGGGLAATNWTSVQILAVAGAFGLILALLLSRAVTILSLGEEVSKGLGQNVWVAKTLGVIVVFVLTGAAVSVAGTVGFIGLIIPHITRYFVGSDYRLIIPVSAVFGALLLVVSDIGARLVNAPFETPVGAITACIGVPFFLYLARGEGRGM
ncbi:iron ABC transporter permease [Halobacillus sp. ACCC02827]|uniref:FecCD family ABC transporter permease n=1 Tax=Halobacillus sp. ACCC02827 TaxID=3052090 RepID=UPI00256FC3D8|nr:iron ABC transporter permease [Halobacillus sp. ACCC02827]WJE16034.1 iron ABC transporter permease [Halobacillus sp. ACCC02827]